MTAQATPPAELVTLTIDGVEVSVPKGSLIIRAAETVGIEIPRFCDHPLLEPAGACRQCLVDVATPGPDGAMRPFPKPQASCTMTVSPGMVVNTAQTSEVAAKAQEGVMEFLLINHPLDCPVCDKGGECPLQNQAMSTGRPVSRFTDVKRTFSKPVSISSQVLLDRERCVLCQRCTRFSEQIAGDPFIALVERGAQQQVGIFQDQPFESYFSGNTVQICPVGALTGAMYRFRSRPFDLVSTPSACEHCASGCAQRTDHRRGVVMRRMASNDPAVNEEWNCDKGRWAFQYGQAADQIQYPLVRDEDGTLREASWPEALAVAADGLRAAKSGGVAVLPGGRLTREDAYAYGKFARVAVDTNDVDFRARRATDEEAAFLASTIVGTSPDKGGVTYADLEAASAVLLVGFEPEEESPMVFLRLRKAMRKSGLKVLSLAPYATRGLTKMGGTLIETAPGTEAEVLDAIRTSHPDLANVSEALKENAVILVGERLAGVPGGLSTARALAEGVGARLAWIPRRAGERGALDAGALGNLLPGGRPVTDGAARVHVEGVWEVSSLPSGTGRSTDAIVDAAAEGAIAGLVVGGVEISDLANPAAAREGLRRAFVVSIEQRRSEATDLADVVLPVSTIAERTGAFLNWEGRVRATQASLNTQRMADHRVLNMLAAEMGVDLGLPTLDLVRSELSDFDEWNGARVPAPAVGPVGLSQIPAGSAILATWHHLLDLGRLQDGEPYLAGTAPAPVARMSATTAAAAGVAEGDAVTVSTQSGSITLPLVVTSMVDNVVWLPANSTGSRVRESLASGAGDVVAVAKAASVSEHSDNSAAHDQKDGVA